MSMLAFESAIEIAARIRRRELSSRECLEYFRQRIVRFNPQINALVAFDWERAAARANAADAALARNELWGPLHGVPMTVKESYDYEGLPTTWGDPMWRDNVATEDDIVVIRLEAAGAVIFGKSNVPLRLMDFQTYNDIYGVTNNPWDVTRAPGGSSGGSAAALAAGLTGVEFGSDIGGSIRNPAHYCGVFGHKPTYGLVGATRAAPPGKLARKDLGVHGPLARSAEDLALVMHYVAGPGPFETPIWQPTLPQPQKQLRELRVVIWPSDARVSVAAEISDRCQHVADVLAKLGATVSDAARPDIDLARVNKLYRTLLEAATNPTGELKHSEWLELDHERAQLRLRWREFFKDWDIVVAPIAATAAFPHDHSALQGRTIQIDGHTAPYFQQIFWAGLVTLPYLPSTAFPTGLNSQGLPIGLQAFADAYNDLITIDFARQLAQEIGGFVPPKGYED